MQSEQSNGQTPRSNEQRLGSGHSADVPPTEIRDPAVSDWLPSRPPPLPRTTTSPQELTQLEPGQRLGDFLICRVLGRGGFAAVYLALQGSLGRQVALKVTLPQSGMSCSDSASLAAGEGQYLAQLDHPHIVRVYQQTIEPHTGAQLLCMQYVAGTTLQRLIERLRDRAGQWSGRDLLAAVEQETLTTAGDTASPPLRNLLVQTDHLETICLLGSQLATALEHAHRRGVVHRDIKPANVLVNRYGQPLLADFNLATGRAGVGSSGLVGGTLAYMSPEQLEAFRSKLPSTSVTADQRGDIYSLGVLLWQTATGQLPFPVDLPSGAAASGTERLTALLQFRRETPVSRWQGSEQFWPEQVTVHALAPQAAPRLQTGTAGRTTSQAMLGTILAMAMHPLPQQRYRNARGFGRTLSGLADLHRARQTSKVDGRLAAAARCYPVVALLLAGLIPQLIASLLQITYNVSRVLNHFQPAQSDAFVQLVWWANPVIYGGCLAFFTHYLWRILPTWRRLQRADAALTAREVDRARNEALRLPRRAASIAGAGWLIGAIVFPVGVILLGGPLPGPVLLHFLMSFLLAGLISVTYSAFALVTVVLRLFYLHFWWTPRHFHKRAQIELLPLDQRLESITLLAGAIPLAAATGLLFAGPRDEDDAATFGFRLLAVLLIVAGGVGFSMVGRVVGGLRKLLRGWMDGNEREADG